MIPLELQATLRALGAMRYDLLLPETHALSGLLLSGEQIAGIVYGRYVHERPTDNIVGRGALLATNFRLLLIDRKPLFTKNIEVTYFAVSGVTYTRVGLAGTVLVNTKVGIIRVRTFNKRCAQGFVTAVEQHILSLRTDKE